MTLYDRIKEVTLHYDHIVSKGGMSSEHPFGISWCNLYVYSIYCT